MCPDLRKPAAKGVTKPHPKPHREGCEAPRIDYLESP